MNKDKKMKIMIIPMILLLLSITGCSNDDTAIGGSGLIEATEVLVSAETSGRIEKLNFDEGMDLNSGDTMLVIDPSRLELEKRSALAKLEVAKSKLVSGNLAEKSARETVEFLKNELDRQNKMITDGASTQQSFDKISHEYDLAEINLSNAAASIKTIKAEIISIEAEIAKIDRMLKDCYPLSPIRGIVSKKYVDRGELVVTGKSIAKIIDQSDIWVKIYLTAEDFSKVKIGDKAKIDTEFDKVFNGTIIWTSEEAEFTPKNVQTKKSRSNLMYAVKAKITDNDGSLKVGMPVYVTLGE